MDQGWLSGRKMTFSGEKGTDQGGFLCVLGGNGRAEVGFLRSGKTMGIFFLLGTETGVRFSFFNSFFHSFRGKSVGGERGRTKVGVAGRTYILKVRKRAGCILVMDMP